MSRRRLALLAATGLAWAVTLGRILHSEVLTHRDSADMRALVESARLTRRHASAAYVVRAQETVLGTLTSAVSGSREEEQLAYVIEGELHAPVAARLKAVVLASWDRRPERLVLDLELAGVRHRVDGALAEDRRTFRVRYSPPGGAPEDRLEWEIEDVPPLAPGPLPLPQLRPDALEARRSGQVEAPGGAGTIPWRIEGSRDVTLAVGGRLRSARRTEILAGSVTVVAWTDENGFPLRLELPGGIVIELAEDSPS